MPKYDDFNLDVQKADINVKEFELKSCWHCPSKYPTCINTSECNEN